MATKPHIITISRGPQFSGTASRVVFLISLTSFIGGIYLLAHAAYPAGVAALVLAGISAPLFLDYRGVQIDQQNNRVRQYTSYLGLKHGEWNPLDKFDKIILKWERFSYRSGGTPATFAFSPFTTRTSDAYTVYLVDVDDHTRLELGDFDTHKGARKFMAKYSHLLALPAEDKYQQRLESAQRTREEVESRRR